MGESAETAKATRREWIGLAVIALPCLLYSMDLTVLNLALPEISATLRPSASELLWIVDIYGFLVAGSLITMGTLGDRIGRRRLLMIGAAAFGVASVLAAFSSSPGMLIAMRAVLGVAGATLAPSTLSLIRNMFLDARERTFAIGVWVTSYSVGGALGPLLGGLLLEHFWWGSVLLIGVPVMLLLLLVGPRLLPEYRASSTERLDPLSAGLSLVAVLAIIYGIKNVAESGLTWLPLSSVGVGLMCGGIFVRRQRTLPTPLIDLGLFRVPAFSASLLTYTLGTFAAFGGFVFLAQYLQLVLGLSPLGAGLATLPWAGGFIIGSMATPALVQRARAAVVISGGLAVAALGFALLSSIAGSSALAVVLCASLVLSLGLAPVFTLATDQIVGAAPPDRAGAASALSETSSELGGALGIAILGSIGAALYRSVLAGTLPDGLPAEAARAVQTTLGAALSLAAGAEQPLGGELASAARAAFTQAFRLGSGVCALILIATAALAYGILGRVRDGATSKAGAEPGDAAGPTVALAPQGRPR